MKSFHPSVPAASLDSPPTLGRTLIVAAFAVAYALLAHVSTAQGGHGTLGALLAIGPVGFIALIFAWRSKHRALGIAMWLLAVVLTAMHWQELKAHFVWIYLLQQVGLYCLLGLTFGRTMAAGSIPLCTRMALHVHGDLSGEAFRYTRQVTLAWTLFFAGVSVTLIVAFFAAPLRLWSGFANFGVPVLIALMFAVEHRVRRRVLPDMAHAGIIATVRASTTVGLRAAPRRS